MKSQHEEHFVGHAAIKVIISHDNEVLLVRGITLNSGWDLPGGHLHQNELPQDAVKREVFEELGITDLQVGAMIHSEIFFHPGTSTDTLMLVYHVVAPRRDFILAEDELAEARWFGVDELQDIHAYDNVAHALNAYKLVTKHV